MWDPYSIPYAYARSNYPFSNSKSARRRRGSASKPMFVNTVPVTNYGGAQAVAVTLEEVAQDAVPAVKLPTVARFQSGDAAATKIQAVYRGYAVRKTQPLKQLREIKKVKE